MVADSNMVNNNDGVFTVEYTIAGQGIPAGIGGSKLAVHREFLKACFAPYLGKGCWLYMPVFSLATCLNAYCRYL
ncbi:hypothetical protein GUJ93_ZPchr0012g19663 [Zizania palustris]|uniref:Uncharacterized protein n=1 Tax=Zizania palustris TaxID=103762 RepID=A0A8J6BT85_ZIZPA|nr:hypothetical protein GUJ93_ZPchr0012g19663 [Zizania palustris]